MWCLMYLHHHVAMMTSEYDIHLQGIAPEFAYSPMRKLHKHQENLEEICGNGKCFWKSHLLSKFGEIRFKRTWK